MDLCWFFFGSLQLLNSFSCSWHGFVEKCDGRLCLERFSAGLGQGQLVPCRFCSALECDGHLFWECTFPPLVEIRENPECHDLMRVDKGP